MRRLWLIALWLAPCAVFAQVRAVPEGVQLRLDFAPAVTTLAAALPVASLTPSAALTPSLIPAPAPIFAEIPKPVLAAFHAGDAPAFLKASRAAEYEPPEGDEHQNALYQLGLEREAADRAVRGLDKPAVAAKTTKIDYDEFGRQLARAPGLSLNPFQHADAKRRILKASGYARLYGTGGVPIKIDDAADIRVGKAFASVLRAFERR